MGLVFPQPALPAMTLVMSCPSSKLLHLRGSLQTDEIQVITWGTPGLDEGCQVGSEESGFRNSVPAGKMRGLMSSVPLASTDKPQDLGWEVLPVRVPSVPEGEAECRLGESGSPPHSPITRQRGRTRKEGGLGSCCLTDEGDGGDAEQVIILIYLKKEFQGLEAKQTTHLKLKTNTPNLLFWPSALFHGQPDQREN